MQVFARPAPVLGLRGLGMSCRSPERNQEGTGGGDGQRGGRKEAAAPTPNHGAESVIMRLKARVGICLVAITVVLLGLVLFAVSRARPAAGIAPVAFNEAQGAIAGEGQDALQSAAISTPLVLSPIRPSLTATPQPPVLLAAGAMPLAVGEARPPVERVPAPLYGGPAPEPPMTPPIRGAMTPPIRGAITGGRQGVSWGAGKGSRWCRWRAGRQPS